MKTNMKDIEDLEALMNAVNALKQTALETNTDVVYSVAIKKEVVRLKTNLSVKSEAMDREVGLPAESTDAWTMLYKPAKHAVAVLHGTRMRYDVPTKCAVIKMHLEDGIPIHKLAETYGVSQPAISNWKRTYKTKYPHYINGIDKTMIIGKEEKAVYGVENISHINHLAALQAEIAKKSMMILGEFEDPEPAYKAINDMETITNSL